MSEKEQAIGAFWHLAAWVIGNPGEALCGAVLALVVARLFWSCIE